MLFLNVVKHDWSFVLFNYTGNVANNKALLMKVIIFNQRNAFTCTEMETKMVYIHLITTVNKCVILHSRGAETENDTS